ncbi:acyl-CoA thioesterase [Adhaeribacter aquaticus]|uniref:acyl-CoA thioesterase n=1 Tax=Adhaeribacter aquaticus TaxID=299567 RepID=UPI0004075D57|nr:acyl-CoA thioesterase [Adhaeribacter aquaticus]
MAENYSNSLPRTPESTVFIKVQDCDPQGHLNNVRYLDYFLNAREEHTQTYYDLNLMTLAREQKASWVVTNHHIAYVRPAAVGEQVVVQTKIIHFDNSSLVIEATMLNQERNLLKALLWTTMRFVNLETGKTTDHPDTLMDLLDELDVGDVMYEPDGFYERVKEVKHQVKKS